MKYFYNLYYIIFIQDSSPNIQEIPLTSYVNNMLDRSANNMSSIYKELLKLYKKVNNFLHIMRAVTNKQFKKYTFNEVSSINKILLAVCVKIKSDATNIP